MKSLCLGGFSALKLGQLIKRSDLGGISVWRPQSRHTMSRIDRVSHQIPAESEMSRQNRATPHQIKVSHLSLHPRVAHSSHSQQAGGQGRVSRRAGTFGFQKRIALQGGVAATVTPVALFCATDKKV